MSDWFIEAVKEPTITDWLQAFGILLTVPVTLVAAWLSARARSAGKGADAAREYTLMAGNRLANESLERTGRVMWNIKRDSGSTYRFVNGGSRDVKLLDVSDVSVEGGGNAAQVLDGYVGTFISPGNGFRVNIEKSMADPAVTQVQVRWKEDAQTIEQTYAV